MFFKSGVFCKILTSNKFVSFSAWIVICRFQQEETPSPPHLLDMNAPRWFRSHNDSHCQKIQSHWNKHFFPPLFKNNQSFVFTLVFAYFMSLFGLKRFKEIDYNYILTYICCDRRCVLNYFACRTHRDVSFSGFEIRRLWSPGQVQAYIRGQPLAEAVTVLTQYAGRTMFYL